MKFNLGFLTENREYNIINSFDVYTDQLEFDTDWFIDTKPSINDTDLFLPEFENTDDICWVLMYLLAECSIELLHNNFDNLCDEARLALQSYNNLFHPYILEESSESSSELLREVFEKLQKE